MTTTSVTPPMQKTEPKPKFPTGKKAMTILSNEGDFVHIVSDVPYNIRSRHIAQVPVKGSRPMHKSTLGIKTQPLTDYQTTVQTYHGGHSSKLPPPIHPPYPSQHLSHIDLADNNSRYWNTMYGGQFNQKDTQHPQQIHYPSRLNKLNMNEGNGIKDVLDGNDERNNYKYWSQYNRVHNKLGIILGPGVERERDIRQQYNPLTGEEKGAGWNEENRRVSGNRVLYRQRQDTGGFFLG